MRFQAKIQKQQEAVYDLRVTQEDQERWYIIKIPRPKQRMFEKMLNGNTPFDLMHYGTLLYSGYGEPSEARKRYLEAEFGLVYEADNA